MILRETRCGGNLDKLQFMWNVIIKPKAFYLIGLIAIGMSLFLLVGELLILLQLNFSLLDIIPKISFVGQLAQNLISMILFLYLSFCVNYGCFNIKLSSVYELHPNRQTDSFSLIYSSLLLTRLAAPMCINFLNIIHLEGTCFGSVIGAMDPIPLIGKQFQNIFPTTLLLLCIFNVFNLWSNLMIWLGLDEYSFC